MRVLRKLRSFRRDILGVMRGLDPRIHDETPMCKALLQSFRPRIMDRRVKPGNDN
jgi:hypothetical protein